PADIQPCPLEDGFAFELVELGRAGVAERYRPGAELRVVLRPAALRRFRPATHTVLLLSHHRSAVDTEGLTGDEPGLLRTEKPDCCRDVVACPEVSERDAGRHLVVRGQMPLCL